MCSDKEDVVEKQKAQALVGIHMLSGISNKIHISFHNLDFHHLIP